ncbi:MAG: hypothetical protein ACLFU4_01955 [Opitutales bacterium]
MFPQQPPSPSTRFNLLYSLFFCLALCLPGLGTAQSGEDVEVLVNVLPEKGMKYNPDELYQEDQEVIQGVLGSSRDDTVDALALMPSGHILMAGRIGSNDSKLADRPRLGCSEQARSGAFIAVTDGKFRELFRVAFLPSTFSQIRKIEIADDGSVFLGGESARGSKDNGLAVMKLPAKLDAMTWRIAVPGDRMTGLALLPDGSAVVAPNKHPFISRIRPDGSGLIPFGDDPHFRTDGKNPQIRQKWWLDQNYPERGVGHASYHRGNAGGVATTHDGNLVFITSNFVKHKNGSPDFDPMLIKFTPEGEILWATHLLEGLPALSDHKSPHLYVCPYSGDIIAAMRQHGHFETNLQVSDNAYLKTDNWLTGNIMIGWIGRIDPDTGSVKAGTMYFPDMGRPPSSGKRTANSLMPAAVRTDREGNIYVAGLAAHKLDTTMHAFQSEKMGDSGFISVFDASLTRLRYANLITGHGYSYQPTALLVTELGPLVATLTTRKNSSSQPARLIDSNTDKTNFLSPSSEGGSDVIFSLLPSEPWKQDW